jgi:hypothetical protein
MVMLKKWNADDLPLAVKESINYSQVCRRLGLSHISANFKTIKKYITKLGLSTEHFNSSAVDNARARFIARVALTYDEIFCENSKAHGTTLRRQFRKLTEYVCAICENTGNYLGRPLTLQIDHINGVRNDNRRINLRYLCPNCHSQTDTYGHRLRQ